MFDLAETLGMTVEQLQREMPERELDEWALRRKPLAPRRVERMLAQICAFIAWSTGNKDYAVADADLFSHANLELMSAPPQSGEEMVQDFAIAHGGLRIKMPKRFRKAQVNDDGGQR